MTEPIPGSVPPPPPPPPSMPPMPPGGGSAGQTNGTATAAMICGILSLVCFGILTGIPAIFLGISGRKKAEEMGGEGNGQATAGLILGIISTILSIIGIIFFILAIVLADDAVSDSVKRANDVAEESREKSRRDGAVADSDHYTIDEAEIEDSGYGSFTYEAFIENDASFETGYEIDVRCEGDAGDEDTQTTYVTGLEEGDRKSFKAYFYFDDDTATADCEVDEVKYSY